jgi:hypothetical protein
LTTVDPIAALETVFQDYASYQSDDATPVTETYANNGLDVEAFPYGKRHALICPLIQVGPISSTIVKPQNIGDSPNSRWLYQHMIECHLYTQDFQNPNVSGYNAKTKLWESIRAVLIQKQSSVDGSGNWLLMTLSSGPHDGPDTAVTPDRFDTVFIVKLQRSQVD